jgi:serine/threonine-protein kinase
MADEPAAGELLSPGGRIAGYLIEDRIGAGGMAVVFRARDEVLGRLVALKILSPALAADGEFRARFLRESQAVASVEEPHVIPVYGAGEWHGVLYIAMRFVPGGDLAMLARRAGGFLEPGIAASLVAQVASALDAAHAAGLVHRDVKPGNILVGTPSQPGRPGHVYLSDFGLTRSTGSATGLTATGQFLGTPDYCAPEQIAGGPVDGRTDQYALACVAFCLLAGSPPFQHQEVTATLWAHMTEPAPLLAARHPGLPAAVDGVLARALEKDPSRRFASCGEFAAALARAATCQPAVPPAASPPPVPAPADMPRAGTPPRFAPWGYPGTLPPAPGTAAPAGRRRRTALVAGAAAVILAAAGVATALALPGSAKPGPPQVRPTGSPAPTFTATSLVAPFTAAGDFISSADFSPDDRFLATDEININITKLSTSEALVVWNVATHKKVITLSVPQFSTSVGDPVFNTIDSTLTVITSPAKSPSAIQVLSWNLLTGKQTQVLSVSSPEKQFEYVQVTTALSGDGTTLAIEDPAGTGTDLWNLSTGKRVAELTEPTTSPIAGISVDNDGQRVAVSDKSGTTYVWDAVGRRLATFHYTYQSANSNLPPDTPEISPDGTTVEVFPNGNAPTTLWDIATQANITPHDTRWPRHDNLGLFSTDGKFIVTRGNNDASAVLWNVATHSYLFTVRYPGHVSDQLPFAISVGAGELVTLDRSKAGQAAGRVYLWHLH